MTDYVLRVVRPSRSGAEDRAILDFRKDTTHEAHRFRARLLGDTAQLGELDRALRAKGHQVIAPGYPGFEIEVEVLNADPAPILALTMPGIIARHEAAIRELPEPPIIIGHSAGGAFTQVLLDHGLGAVGVAMNSAPTEGVRVVPLSQVKSTFPVLKSPANRHRVVPLTFEEWQYAFTNTFTEDKGRALYERYAMPANGGILWGSVLANFQPGHQDTRVDYHNDKRAPLLFVSRGGVVVRPDPAAGGDAGALRGLGPLPRGTPGDRGGVRRPPHLARAGPGQSGLSGPVRRRPVGRNRWIRVSRRRGRGRRRPGPDRGAATVRSRAAR
jgi:hypothetical protein